jgi:hypothetical protein
MKTTQKKLRGVHKQNVYQQDATYNTMKNLRLIGLSIIERYSHVIHKPNIRSPMSAQMLYIEKISWCKDMGKT